MTKDAKALQWRTDIQQIVLEQLNINKVKNETAPPRHQDGLNKHNKVTTVNKDMEKLELYAINTVVIISLGT